MIKDCYTQLIHRFIPKKRLITKTKTSQNPLPARGLDIRISTIPTTKTTVLLNLNSPFGDVDD